MASIGYHGTVLPEVGLSVLQECLFERLYVAVFRGDEDIYHFFTHFIRTICFAVCVIYHLVIEEVDLILHLNDRFSFRNGELIGWRIDILYIDDYLGILDGLSCSFDAE